MKHAAILAASILAWTVPAAAQTEPAITLLPADLQWTEVGPGVEFAPAYGDWATEAHGKFVRFAPGAAAGMHTHTAGYSALVIAGSFTNVYEGDAEPVPMPSGSYWFTPGGVPHSNTCLSEEPCIIYTHSPAAFDFAPVEE